MVETRTNWLIAIKNIYVRNTRVTAKSFEGGGGGGRIMPFSLA